MNGYVAKHFDLISNLYGSLLNSFRNISDNRENLYKMYDSMSKDILISSIN